MSYKQSVPIHSTEPAGPSGGAEERDSPRSGQDVEDVDGEQHGRSRKVGDFSTTQQSTSPRSTPNDDSRASAMSATTHSPDNTGHQTTQRTESARVPEPNDSEPTERVSAGPVQMMAQTPHGPAEPVQMMAQTPHKQVKSSLYSPITKKQRPQQQPPRRGPNGMQNAVGPTRGAHCAATSRLSSSPLSFLRTRVGWAELPFRI